jgi:uncharacterized membrane protein
MIENEVTTWLTMAGMALATIATRLDSLALTSRLRLSPFAGRWLRQIPAAVLVAIIAPELVQSGWQGIIAGALTALVSLRTHNVLLAMVAGVVAVWVLRQIA